MVSRNRVFSLKFELEGFSLGRCFENWILSGLFCYMVYFAKGGYLEKNSILNLKGKKVCVIFLHYS